MRGWLRLSSLLIHPSIPTSGLHLCGCLSSCSSCPSKSQFLHYPSPHAASASSELRQWRFPRTCGRNKLASAVSGLINWIERSVGINLKGTEHVVLCGSNGLITGVIKWANTQGFGFWAAWVGIADDSSWLEMGLEQGKMYHPLTWARILSSWEKLRLMIDASHCLWMSVSMAWTGWGEWRSTSSIIPVPKVVSISLFVEDRSPDWVATHWSHRAKHQKECHCALECV